MGRVRTDEEMRSAAKIGLKISQLRVQRHLSQEALAEKAGMDRVTLTRIESGQRIPDAALLIALSKPLMVQPGDLFPQSRVISENTEAFENELHGLLMKMSPNKKELFCNFILQAASGFISDSAV